jgi:hypothetical protein
MSRIQVNNSLYEVVSPKLVLTPTYHEPKMECGSRSDLRVTYFERTKLASKGPRPAEWRLMWRAWNGERARSIRSFFVRTNQSNHYLRRRRILSDHIYIYLYITYGHIVSFFHKMETHNSMDKLRKSADQQTAMKVFEDEFLLQNILHYVGDYQFQFLASVNRSFYEAYTTVYAQKQTYYNDTTMEHAKVCYGCEWNHNSCAAAAKRGHWNVLKWAHENGWMPMGCTDMCQCSGTWTL